MTSKPNVTSFFKILEVPHGKRQTLSVLKNPDLEPILKGNQTWGFWSNVAYWSVCAFSIGTWMGASAANTIGLTYGETVAAFCLGNFVAFLFTIANSYQGLNWKVGYTLSQRFVFGIYGSGFGILIRILMSIVNYGANAWLGGLCVNLILDSWSHHYLHLENTLPDNIAMTSKQVIGFMIFHVICALTYFMKPYKMNYLLIWSSFFSCFSMLGMVIYLAHKSGGVGHGFTVKENTVKGSDYNWNWVYMISYWFGSISSSATNQADFSRFANSKLTLWTGTFLGLMIPGTIVPLFGIVGLISTQKLYNEALWIPTDICEKWLFLDYNAKSRAAVFFCGISFTSALVGFTSSSCGFSGGMDLSGILPKYVNIFRGALITAAISFACQPWNFYNSSSIFLTVMSSFGIIMTPIISVMICDNFLIRKQQYSVSQAFIVKGEYYYTKGVNWKIGRAHV
ncbi:related to Thiamine transporter [Saccharomycodes ludwigii]|uniref:Related to Thiamine transporter n=1 Tax=Saccharomycodes ludwigii TaxID=36035 RepID=A0A376BBH0_9ASCO|nr:related to Thiamine transporter [Saccharomycodes ludwigii]